MNNGGNMKSFKKLLKKSKIYNFFSYNFNLIKYKINQLELENNNISKDTYYNTMNKVIYLTAKEFGEI